jgi:biopolymer transport protein ExbD
LKKSKSLEVELPITPMLDMAFQLLTFFILTYKPAPTEGQFAMNLLPAQAATEIKKEQQKETDNPTLDVTLRTLTTVLRAGGNGILGEVMLNEKPIVGGMEELKKELESFVNDPVLSFDQALIKVDPRLKYSEVIKVIDIFSSLKGLKGEPKPLTKLSFAELNSNEGGGPP